MEGDINCEPLRFHGKSGGAFIKVSSGPATSGQNAIARLERVHLVFGSQALAFQVWKQYQLKQEIRDRVFRVEPVATDSRQRRVHRVNSFGLNDVKTVLLYEFADTVSGISLEIGRIFVFRLHERDAKIKVSSGFAHTGELVHYLMWITHMLHHSIANYCIKEPAWLRDLMQRRGDMDVCAVQALGDVLVE